VTQPGAPRLAPRPVGAAQSTRSAAYTASIHPAGRYAASTEHARRPRNATKHHRFTGLHWAQPAAPGIPPGAASEEPVRRQGVRLLHRFQALRRSKRKSAPRLQELLTQAEERLREPDLSDTWSTLTVPDFIRLVNEARDELGRGELSAAKAAQLWVAFAPTCDWDDIVGDSVLGNEIFELIDTAYGRPPAA